MNDSTKNQCGSDSRDQFKLLHKQKLDKKLWACDIDFVLVEKHPFPDIIAALDFKVSGDSISFSEVIAYNSLIRRGIPVYIVQGDQVSGVFKIQIYCGGNHTQPRYDILPIATTTGWPEFELWEQNLRAVWRKRFSQ
jgi:hypothetical protein